MPSPHRSTRVAADGITRVAADVDKLCRNIGQVIQGKSDVVRNAVICMLAQGHLLLEDVPGTGKTSLARALASSISLTWHRIQFTPDLLPSDVTGVSIYNQQNGAFEFKPGPVFANIVLADEINRASPKTQSALLEVMEEGTLSTDGVVHQLPRPFMVVATQNPIDMEGTYLLPEAQLDRFLMKLAVGYPSAEAESEILRTQKMGSTIDRLSPVLSEQDVRTMIEVIRTVEVAPALEHYIVSIAAATRTMSELRLGISPRGSLALLRAARAAAAVAARPYVTPEDIKDMAPIVLAHRVILQPDAELQGRTGAELVTRALQTVPVPRSVLA
ncbi:AAA family ATPase [uncultured Jatrophihabitans sp.]|uniref:AAA family ATPase n=1 Tax=uncultured Jatrophihabitans sp. TaxID=1610747 RepID=UPI0035CB2553